jgi:hypothetical protein
MYIAVHMAASAGGRDGRHPTKRHRAREAPRRLGTAMADEGAALVPGKDLGRPKADGSILAQVVAASATAFLLFEEDAVEQ